MEDIIENQNSYICVKHKSMINFFTYYCYKLSNDLVFQADVVKAVIAGFVAFLSAFFVFWAGKLLEWNKERKRLKDVRNALYHDLFYCKNSLNSEYNRMLNFIRKCRLELIPKNYKALNEGFFNNPILKTDLFKYYPKNDLYNILVFKHSEKNDKRIYNMNSLEINLKSLNAIYDAIKTSNLEYQNYYIQATQNIMSQVNIFKQYLLTYKTDIIANLNVQPMPSEINFKVRLLNLYVANIRMNELDQISKFMDQVMDLYEAEIRNFPNININYVEVSIIAANINTEYTLLISHKKSYYNTIKQYLKNVKGTELNFKHILLLEYPELLNVINE